MTWSSDHIATSSHDHTSATWMGWIYLGLNLLVSVIAQLVLKAAMMKVGEFEIDDNWLRYAYGMINIEIIGGLFLYGTGTILWILCLTKLDLSLAYPAGTLQYLLIFAGAWWFFDERITAIRLLGMIVICIGVFIMSVERRVR